MADHVYMLAKALEERGDLDPILVLRIGREAYLIDGHHRLAAYRGKGRKDIPVCYFKGTVRAAVLAAGEANSKAVQPMTRAECADYAWRLTLIGGYSKAATATAASVSERLVANMRTAKKTLGEQAAGHKHWWRAREAALGKEQREMTDKERDEWKEALAEEYAERLRKTFSNKLVMNPEVAAMAFGIHFGEHLQELLYELSSVRDRFCPEDDDYNTDF